MERYTVFEATNRKPTQGMRNTHPRRNLRRQRPIICDVSGSFGCPKLRAPTSNPWVCVSQNRQNKTPKMASFWFPCETCKGVAYKRTLPWALFGFWGLFCIPSHSGVVIPGDGVDHLHRIPRKASQKTPNKTGPLETPRGGDSSLPFDPCEIKLDQVPLQGYTFVHLGFRGDLLLRKQRTTKWGVSAVSLCRTPHIALSQQMQNAASLHEPQCQQASHMQLGLSHPTVSQSDEI